VPKWATYYGGHGHTFFGDVGYSIQSDGKNVWVCGSTTSPNFPIDSSGVCNSFNQDTLGNTTINLGLGTTDLFILQFNISGVRKWATYYGVDGESDGMYISSDGTNLFVAGDALNKGYLLINPGGGAYYQDTLGGTETPIIGKFCIACGELTATTTSTPAECNMPTGSITIHPAGGTTPYTYLWKPGNQTTDSVTGLSAGTYTVIITGANGCSTDTLYDTVFASTGFFSSINTTTNNQKICAGSSVILSATATNIKTPLTWQPGALSGVTVIVTPTVTTTYTVTATNACGTADTTVTIEVNPLPSPAFNAGILSGCSPLCIQFYNLTTISSGKIITYNWNFGNGDSSSNQNPAYCYKTPGIYSVKITATSDSSCSSTLTKQNYITVYTNPVANFTATPQPTTILNPTIQFTDNSTDAYGIAQWNWGFGDASDSNSQNQNTSHTYHDTGTYCADLMVMNIYGCIDSATNCLVIAPLFTLYIPSAFSPNGDGLNDIFEAKGDYIKSFEIYIFDRWGVEVFHSTDIANGWNGEFKNKSCQEDAYVYVITVYDSENTKHSYTGTVNLLK